jgi:hypothetical protein
MGEYPSCRRVEESGRTLKTDKVIRRWGDGEKNSKFQYPCLPAGRQTPNKSQIPIAQTRPLALDFGDRKLFGISDLEFKEY